MNNLDKNNVQTKDVHCEDARQSKDSKNEESKKEESSYVSLFGHKVGTADLFKLLGLLAFIGITAGIVIALWPSLSQIFEPNGTDRVIEAYRAKELSGSLCC